MTDFGKCADCRKRAIVKLQGTPLCLQHFDAHLALARQVLETLIASAGKPLNR